MRRSVNLVIGLDLIFLLFLTLSPAVGGAAGEILYYAAFLIPIAIGLLLIRGKPGLRLLPNKKELPWFFHTLSFFAPTAAVVILLAMAASAILAYFGKSDAADLSGILPLDLLLHALLPAILEELLLRYIPLRLLAEDKRLSVLLSSLFFALVHCNLFRIPYAFAAGILFAAADLFAGCLLPSLLFHFLINTLSIFYTTFGTSAGFRTGFLIVLILLFFASFAVLILQRKRIFARFSAVFPTKSKLLFSFESVIFAIITLYIAFSAILT